jgi:Tol biopolymer transport system component
MRAICFTLLFSVSLVLCSCGGGGANHAEAPLGTAFAAGELQGRAAATNPPVTTTSSTVAATGIKGIFSILKLRELNTSLAETRILFDSDYQGSLQLYSMAPDGTDLTRVTSNNWATFGPSASQQGKIAFGSQANGNADIYSSNVDGTSPALLVSNGAADYMPRWSPDGTRLAFLSYRANDTPNVFVLNFATAQTTQLTSFVGVNLTGLGFSGDGKKIYYSTGIELFIVPATGGASQPILSSDGTFKSLAVSPDGSEIALSQQVNGTGSIVRFGPATNEKISLPLPNIPNDVCYSPDSQFLLFSMNSQQGSSKNIYSMDKNGFNFAQMTDHFGIDSSPTWSFPIKDRTLIASAGGILGTTAAGIIYAQSGSATTSVVTFDATTPSSVVITQQTGLSASTPNLIFSVDADNIPKMAFANGSDWHGVRIIGSGTPVTTANGALVSIDASTGRVATILPFTGSRSIGSKPTFKYEGGKEIFQGHFLGAYDSKGKNIAPDGASRVILDSRTGILTAN